MIPRKKLYAEIPLGGFHNIISTLSAVMFLIVTLVRRYQGKMTKKLLVPIEDAPA